MTHDKFPNLPDAPTFVSVSDLNSASPYHKNIETKEQNYFCVSAINDVSISCVFDFSKETNEALTFTPESLDTIDKIIDKFQHHDSEDTEFFVAEVGSYVYTLLRKHLKGEINSAVPYFFSSLRFKTKEGKILETNPFAQVTKRISDKEEPTMKAYYQFVRDKISK